MAGTNISVSGPTSAVVGQAAKLTIALRDSAGMGIPERPLTITSALDNVISNPNPTTGLNGTATVDVIPRVGGTDAITVVGNGATAIHAVSVSTDSFVFVDPAPAKEIPLGTAQPLTVRWKSSDSNVDGLPVGFATSRGTLSSATGTTDSTGQATVTIQSDNAGPAIVTATGNSGPTAQLDLLFVATTAHSMTLQAGPATIGTNPDGGSAEQSEIIAVVRDPANNPVKGKQVDFTLTDTTGGRLASSSAITDAFGRAGVVYIAGAVPSAQGGVRIDAGVTDAPSVSNTVHLTVARSKLFITLGTGNEILKLDTTRYAKPYGVLVTDAIGGPVANARIALSVIPVSYRKGYYVWTGKSWEQIPTLQPAANGGLDYCANEDADRNGILEVPPNGPDNDANNNGVLDPGNLATLSSDTVTTDASGFAPFEVRYFQEYAGWVDVELTARDTVSGSEAIKTVHFTLPILADDLAKEGVAPPGHPSPFGTGQSCAGDIALHADTALLTGGKDVVLTLTQNGTPLTGTTIDATVVYRINNGSLVVTAPGGATNDRGELTSAVTVSGGIAGDTATIHYRGLDGYAAVTVTIP